MTDRRGFPTEALYDLITEWGGPQASPRRDGLLKAMTAALVERRTQRRDELSLGLRA